MSNNHKVTREIGNLRGFSTDNSFVRPTNVADKAVNIQMGPDQALQIRRGYQAQIANVGGGGFGTVDNPATDTILSVCVGLDGYLYQKVEKQIYFEYDGRITGSISNVTNPSADLTNIESISHGLDTGAQVIIRNVNGAVELNNPSTFGSTTYNFYTITVVDVDNFTLDGIPYSSLTPYTMGGDWSVNFADNRYLSMRIYVDPDYIYSISDQSINCEITTNRAGQVNGNQSNTNTIVLQYGHSFATTNVAQFYDSLGRSQERNVTSTTPTSISIDGDPVSVVDGAFINELYTVPFGKGFDVVLYFPISIFISTITDPINGIYGLKVDSNGDTSLPAAFLQLLESTIIASGTLDSINFWYWEQVNSTVSPPLPGSANTVYLNSREYEIASMAVFDDVIYIANGADYPQKFDGQNVYRAGMPIGMRVPTPTDNTTYDSKPFNTPDQYQYAITYEQVDNRGHIVEGEISEIRNYNPALVCAADLTISNLVASVQNNWNTDFALATGGAATSYGPDVDGFYYNFIDVSVGFTLKIGDNAYYGDTTCATLTTDQTDNVLAVTSGHGVLPGDIVYFIDGGNVERERVVSDVSSATITIPFDPVTVTPTSGAPYVNVLVYKTSKVFADVAIIDGNQDSVNNIVVKVGHNVQVADIISFTDANGNLQTRNVLSVDATHVEVDGNAVDVSDLFLMSSENQRSNQVTFQRLNANGATLGAGAPISNNLRINIYRTLKNEDFGTNGELYLVASIPNDGSGAGTQVYTDGLIDDEILNVREFDDPDQAPNPPPISKYLRSFGNQMFYGGGERGNPDNSDRVFFSDGNNPEIVPLATNSFNVPNLDDDVTGLGVSGTTLVTTKNKSLWAATGNFLTGQIEVVQIAPGTNIGCVAHATIASVGALMYFTHTNGVYAITENQLFPTDASGNPIPLSRPIDKIFRVTNYLPYAKYVLKRAVAINYTKDNQYILFMPCEDPQSEIRTANLNSIVLCFDYAEKNWFLWNNINAAGGFAIIDDDLYWQERRYSRVDGNTGNLYKQHRFYRLIDHADHAGAQYVEWASSWEDLKQPQVRKKFSRCVLLMDRVSELLQNNNPVMTFSTYLDRIEGLQDTIVDVTTVDNTRNAGWSTAPWSYGSWSGYQDTFISIGLKQGTVAKSMQIGFKMQGINMDFRFAGFQLEIIPENRITFAR